MVLLYVLLNQSRVRVSSQLTFKYIHLIEIHLLACTCMILPTVHISHYGLLLLFSSFIAPQTNYCCQVFYHRQGLNYWKATLAFFSMNTPIPQVSCL